MASIVYQPNSSNVVAVSWFDDGSLFVDFTGGGSYQAKTAVPKSVIVEWIAAESAGKFFHSLKDRYEFIKTGE